MKIKQLLLVVTLIVSPFVFLSCSGSTKQKIELKQQK